jgi:hypothetical protein
VRPILVVTFVRHAEPSTRNKVILKLLKLRFLIPSQKTHAFVSAKGMPTMALKQRQFGPLMAITSGAFLISQ